MGIGHEVLDVPFGEMVTQLASAVAASQSAMDMNSIVLLKEMGDVKKNPVYLPIINASGEEDTLETSMIGAGFQPTFYQFSDAIIEVKMTISASRESSYERERKTEYGPSTSTSIDIRSGKIVVNQTKIKSSTVNATYTNRYNFSEEASSTLRVRLVPLPPNPTMQRFIELRAQKQQLQYELEIKKTEMALEAERAKIASTST